jgi:uncharacterized membrane protein SpoIIM required for sporulation
MSQSFSELLQMINFQIFIFSALLFFVGYAAAPTAYYKNIKWLTAYPFFIIKLMDKYLKQNWPPLIIFLVIFTLNTTSLTINLLSGWGIILPYIFVVYMGLNIGVVMYHTLQGRFYYLSLLNPVALLELPAAWLSIAMAIQFSLTRYFQVNFIKDVAFGQYIGFFMVLVIPLLILAAVIETFLIVFARKKEKQDRTPED